MAPLETVLFYLGGKHINKISFSEGEANFNLFITLKYTPPFCPQHTTGRNSLLQPFDTIHSS